MEIINVDLQENFRFLIQKMGNELTTVPRRKPKEIKKIKDKVVEALAADLSTNAALKYAGVTKDEFNYFLEHDENFRDLCENARGLVELKAIMNVSKEVMEGNVSVSKWLLERTSPKYSKKADVKVEGVPVTVPVEDKEQELAKIMEKFGVIEAEAEEVDE